MDGCLPSRGWPFLQVLTGCSECALCVCSLFVLLRAVWEAGGGGAERGDETRAAREKTRERECDCHREVGFRLVRCCYKVERVRGNEKGVLPVVCLHLSRMLQSVSSRILLLATETQRDPNRCEPCTRLWSGARLGRPTWD